MSSTFKITVTAPSGSATTQEVSAEELARLVASPIFRELDDSEAAWEMFPDEDSPRRNDLTDWATRLYRAATHAQSEEDS